MTISRAGISLSRVVFGVFVVALGVLFTLDNLGLVDAGEALRFWPLALVAIGVTCLAEPGRTSRCLSGFIWIFAGVWLLLEEFHYVRIRLWDFWPVLLVILGASIVWRALAPSPAHGADEASVVHGLAIMSGINRTVTSRDFKGGQVTAMMGGCKLDLRGAAIGGEPAVIDVFAFWGGVELVVPDTWVVDLRAIPLLGGVENRTRPPADQSQRLVVTGTVVMGGVEVKN